MGRGGGGSNILLGILVVESEFFHQSSWTKIKKNR